MVINPNALSPFGAEIKGFDVETATVNCIHALKQILAHSGVAVLRNQPISDAKFVAFLKQLGCIAFTAGETPVAHQPELNLVSNVSRKDPPKLTVRSFSGWVIRLWAKASINLDWEVH
jgi:taurine dioxygenase